MSSPAKLVPPPARRASATAVDRAVGVRIRKRRVALGLSLDDLGRMIGSTGAQVAKYKSGINRTTAGQLHVIAEALEAGIQELFPAPETIDDVSQIDSRTMLELARNFRRIKSRWQQDAVCDLARALAATSND